MPMKSVKEENKESKPTTQKLDLKQFEYSKERVEENKRLIREKIKLLEEFIFTVRKADEENLRKALLNQKKESPERYIKEIEKFVNDFQLIIEKDNQQVFSYDEKDTLIDEMITAITCAKITPLENMDMAKLKKNHQILQDKYDKAISHIKAKDIKITGLLI